MSEKVSTSVHDIVETVNVDVEADSNPNRKEIDHDKIVFKGPNME